MKLPFLLLLLGLSGGPLLAAYPPEIEDKGPAPEGTEVWKTVPAVSTPAGGPPSDAIILFDGKSLDAWESLKNKGKPAEWTVADGAFTVKPGTGDIRTKESFGDLQLHLEFRTPPAEGKGQQRGNSGVFFMQLYELQILDSYQSESYANGQAASIYKQQPPLVNASRAPGEWQTYDVVWIAPRFDAEGKMVQAPRMTVFHNGVLVQDNFVLRGTTEYRGHPLVIPHPEKLPIKLQDHDDLVSFRNIWVRPLAERK